VLVRYNTIYNTSMNVRACWTSTNNVIERNLLVKTRMSSATSYQYGNIRGYQLSGSGNIARDNMGCQAKTIIDNYDAGLGIQNGGGNQFPVDPLFDSIAPNGFRPRDSRCITFGRYSM